MPTHARSGQLAACLGGLARQVLAGESFEVIVVDDGSPERQRPRIAPTVPGGIQLLRQPRRGPAAARNAGMARARGELLVFLDDDCVPEPGWLAALLAAHRRDPDALLGGRTRNALPEQLCSEVAESLVGFLTEQSAGTDGRPGFLASNNLAVPARACRAQGGFDEGYPLAAGEDRAFCRRWSAAGGRMHRVDAAGVGHHHALDIRSFCRQQYRYGRGAQRFHRDDATARRPPARFYLSLLVHPLHRPWPWRRRLAGLVLVVLSQCAIATGRWVEWRRDARRSRVS